MCPSNLIPSPNTLFKIIIWASKVTAQPLKAKVALEAIKRLMRLI
jgi:hypothetical protein